MIRSDNVCFHRMRLRWRLAHYRLWLCRDRILHLSVPLTSGKQRYRTSYRPIWRCPQSGWWAAIPNYIRASWCQVYKHWAVFANIKSSGEKMALPTKKCTRGGSLKIWNSEVYTSMLDWHYAVFFSFSEFQHLNISFKQFSLITSMRTVSVLY